MRHTFRNRVQLLAALFIIVALVLGGRLYFVQIVHGDAFSDRANNQYVRPNQNLYNRGAISFLDKNGTRVSAASITSGFTLAIQPADVTDPEQAYDTLSTYIDIDRETFLARAQKINDPYEEITNQISEEVAREIDAADIPGVRLYQERWRNYPASTTAAHTIGFVGYEADGETRSGRYGLERYYENTLAREDTNLYVNFFAEIFANIHRVLVSGGAHRSGDIVTHIDPSVQIFLEDRLQALNATWGSRMSAGIIMDPKTGAINAIGVSPTFNLNDFSDAEVHQFAHPLVEYVYELGSIMKPLTMAIGIDTGAVTPETEYVDRGSATYNGSTISNYDGEARGRVAMQEVLSQSLNTGAAFVEQQTGNEVFAQYVRELGFGKQTGIDLPNEAHGLINNLESPRDIEYATASFGQGIAVTPIGMVRALSALANGGRLVTPSIAARVDYTAGLGADLTEAPGARVFAASTTESVTRMLVNVVDEALAGGDVALEHYSVAAKTGTAQISKDGESGYYEDRFLHSFFGYAPAYNPRFLIFLMTVEPKGVRYASETLTDPFMETTKFLINYYDIPPDR